jgi:hypothetical protein
MEVMVRPQAAMVVTPHPISLQGQRVLDKVAAQFTPGDTLAVLLERQGILPGQQWAVSIGGVDVVEQRWHLVRPKHGYVIEVRRVMHKDVLRIVAIVALSYFTLGAGGIAGGSFLGLTGAAGYIAAGAVFLVGSAVINKMLAPKQVGRSENTTNPTYSLSGGRNRSRAYEPMALVLGEPYAVPDLAAQPYSYFANGEQYLWQMFHLGLNCSEASNLRIGQTSLSAYQGVTTLRNGLASGNSDFPALGTSVDSVAGALLSNSAFTIRTGSAGTVRLALDLVASLFTTTKDGAFDTLQLDVIAEYREVGSGTWLSFTPHIPAVPAVIEDGWTSPADDSGGGPIYWQRVLVPAVPEVPAGYIRLSNASQKPLRVTVERAVAPGQYEVRMLKSTADVSGATGSNAIEWVQLKSYQQDTGTYDGQARLAVQIQASGQLNGALDELNLQLRAAPMDYWDGANWVTATDRASGLCNPGAQFLLVCRGIFDMDGRRLAGLGYEDSQIDIEGLQLFMAHCATNGYDFDLFLQEATSIDELLDAIAYAGLGEKSWRDGKIGVTFFTRDDPIEGVINMANIKAKSFEVSYDTMPTADELEVRYFDRARGNQWKPIRVMSPTVVGVPRSTASQTLVGVTSEAHAATLARFSMAQNIYQRKTVTCEMDLEYMTYRRGAVVSLSHDMTQWGYSGRLLACEDNAGVITLTLDDPAQGTIPLGFAGRYIGLRLPGETQMRVFPVQSFSGESRTVVLDAAWPVGVDLPGTDADNPARDTVWIYDFKAVPGQLLRVLSVEPSANGARLSLVPESEEFWDFVETGEYQPPPNNSLLRDAPEVVGLLVSEQLARQGNTYYTELSVNFEATGPFVRAELWGAVGAGEASPPQRLLAQGQSQTLSWQGGLDERWHLELRLYSDTRASVPFRLYFDVQGLRAPPPDVTDLLVTGNVVSWTPVEVPDLAGYLIRFQYGDNAWWDTAVELQSGVITESPYTLTRRPQGDVTILVKAIDTTGNLSANAASFRYGFSEIAVKNPVYTAEQHPDFLGDITGGAVAGGDLGANDLDEFYEPAMGPMYTPEADPMYGTSQYGEMVYEFTVSSTEAGILVLQYSIAAESLLIEYQTGGADAMYEPDADPMYEPVGESIYGTFSDWEVWPGALDFSGDLEVRFRFTLSAGLSQGVIYELTALIDAPEISEVVDNAVISALGTRLPLTNTYRVIRSVQLTVQSDGGSGVTPRVIDKDPALGPLVEILNTSGVAVAGLLDAEIRGY